MTLSDFINSDAFKKADDNVTIWSWDRLNGYYQFNCLFTWKTRDGGKQVYLTRCGSVEDVTHKKPLTKRKFLDDKRLEDVLGSSEMMVSVSRRLNIIYVTKDCSVVLEDRGIVIKRSEAWNIEQSEENYIKWNRFTIEQITVHDEYQKGEYA